MGRQVEGMNYKPGDLPRVKEKESFGGEESERIEIGLFYFSVHKFKSPFERRLFVLKIDVKAERNSKMSSYLYSRTRMNM